MKKTKAGLDKLSVIGLEQLKEVLTKGVRSEAERIAALIANGRDLPQVSARVVVNTKDFRNLPSFPYIKKWAATNMKPVFEQALSEFGFKLDQLNVRYQAGASTVGPNSSPTYFFFLHLDTTGAKLTSAAADLLKEAGEPSESEVKAAMKAFDGFLAAAKDLAKAWEKLGSSHAADVLSSGYPKHLPAFPAFVDELLAWKDGMKLGQDHYDGILEQMEEVEASAVDPVPVAKNAEDARKWIHRAFNLASQNPQDDRIQKWAKAVLSELKDFEGLTQSQKDQTGRWLKLLKASGVKVAASRWGRPVGKVKTTVGQADMFMDFAGHGILVVDSVVPPKDNDKILADAVLKEISRDDLNIHFTDQEWVPAVDVEFKGKLVRNFYKTDVGHALRSRQRH